VLIQAIALCHCASCKRIFSTVEIFNLSDVTDDE